MKKIIVPVDFSTAAENAAIFAGELAQFYKADLLLYHSYLLVPVFPEYGYTFVSSTNLENAAEFEMTKFKNKIQEGFKIPVNIFTKVENAQLVEGLTVLCDEHQPDLVIMGLSGKNALTRLVVGSNTIKVIHHLTYPVLVIPPKAQFLPIRKLGFACDYKKVIETTPIAPLKKIIKDFNADLYVLNVEYTLNALSAEAVAEGMYISELLKDVKPYYSTIYSEDITNGINWFAEKEKIDWMVVIPKKHNLMEKLFGRSQTKELLYHTNVPVLCMHE
jgi:nucleotide-binding universal stress UspA family protein